ncbi:hypothetical protein V8G56_04340 [Gaetbulibacter aquiaggeris]|uniref:Outer membrane protein beta-barrel domain-containing protein n=1 Tax=Gaetbulibacter aquiaggeris TaxID=1735373 RepID=A0ABW7MMB0_9FLAO
MKKLMNMLFFFGLIIHSYAQETKGGSIKIIEKNIVKSTFNLNHKLFFLNGLDIEVSPQFGNLFMTAVEAKKVWINLKDYYNDFDFGFNLSLNYKFKKSLNLKALYNVGMLEFDSSDFQKVKNYSFKLSIDYVF